MDCGEHLRGSFCMKIPNTTVISILTALLLVVCYAPFDLWALSYLAMVPLMMATRSSNCYQAVLSYGLMGAVLGVGIYYGAIGYGVDALILIIFSFSITFALWGGLSRWVLTQRSEPVVKIFAPALLWVGVETLTGYSPLGVPVYLGLSHSGQPWLIQSASLFGISGVSFLIVLSNSVIAYLLAAEKKEKRIIWPVLVASSVLISNPLFGYLHLNSSLMASTPINISTVQPHIDSETYTRGWQQPENRLFMRDTLLALTNEAISRGSQMVFWSEGGNGYMNMRVPELRESLSSIAREASVDLIVSSNDMNSDGQRFNSLFSISKTGQLLGRYDKQRLLPLAENNLMAGSSALPLKTSHGSLGAAICYESSFPEPLRALTSQGAELLFVTSSEAAFKRSSLALHNAGLSVFRAVENNRWLVRAANTGPSLIVSPRGVITQQTGFYTRGIMSGNVAMLSTLSLFTRFGYLLPLALAVAVVGLFGYILLSRSRKQRKKKSRAQSLAKRMRDNIRPFFIGSSLFVISIVLSVTSSLFVINRVSLDSQASMDVLMSELFYPAVSPLVDVVGKGFLQAESNTCGAAALAFVLSFLGRETNEDEIVDMVKINERGTSMLELKRAAEGLKYSAVGVSENYTALSEEVLPVIAYINDSHYVVVIEVGVNHLNVFDPALGYVRLTRDLFEQTWNGYLLLVRPGPIPDLINKTPGRVASIESSRI